MRWEDIYVSGSAAWLGRRVDVSTSVAEGRYDADEARDDDYLSIREAGDISAADMAVEAATLAVERAGVPSQEYALVVHANVSYQGLDFWSAASYLQSRTIGGRASALEVRQASNGGMAALDLAAGYLTARPGPAAALLTTADNYGLPAIDRYRSDKNIIRADGATAFVLSRTPGVARVLSTVVIGDTTHEGLYRGEGPWNAYSGADGFPVDLRKRTQAYLSKGIGIQDFVDSLGAGQYESISTALTDAGVQSGDIAWWVFPNAGRRMVDWDRRKREFGIVEDRTTWAWGRTVGHIGAGDQYAGFTHLLETGSARPGDRIVLVGIGSGFTFGCAVLEVLAQPQWSASAA